MIRLLIGLLLLFSTNASALSPAILGGVSGGVSACTVKESMETTDTYIAIFGTAAKTYGAAVWTTGGAGYDLCRIDVNFTKFGSPTGNINAYVYGNTGTEPDEGNIIATSTTTLSMGSMTNGWQRFDFNDTALSAATNYWIVLKTDTVGDGSNYIRWLADSTSTPGEVDHSEDGATWTWWASYDATHKVYGR